MLTPLSDIVNFVFNFYDLWMGTFCYELYLENGIVVGVQGGCGLFCGVGLGGWLGTGGVAFAYQGTDWVWLEHLSFVLLNNVTIIMYIYIYG